MNLNKAKIYVQYICITCFVSLGIRKNLGDVRKNSKQKKIGLPKN